MELVKRHQDSDKEWDQITDLKELKLTPAAYLNIWCDWQAELKKNTYLHPGYRDIAGGEMGHFYMLPYLMQNYREIREGDTRIYVHRIINRLFPQETQYMLKARHDPHRGIIILHGKFKVKQQASTEKLIHSWIPTNVFLHEQGRSDTHLCPRCCLSPEMADHMICIR